MLGYTTESGSDIRYNRPDILYCSEDFGKDLVWVRSPLFYSIDGTYHEISA